MTINKYLDQNQELQVKFDEVRTALDEERTQRGEVEQELERYKVYLPEAENLLKEVNSRHKGAYEEIRVL